MQATRRALGALLVGVVLVNTAMVGASAVSTLVAASALGPTWSGTPNAAGILGTAIGALGLGWLMARRGPRLGLMTAYGVACAGASLAFLGIWSGWLVLLVLGMCLLGIGNAGAQLSRYVAADLFRPEQRGMVVGTIVWAGTVGAIVGPNLIAPTAALAKTSSLPPLVGVYAVALVAMLGAGVAASSMSGNQQPTSAGSPRSGLPLHRFKQPAVGLAVTAMVAANFTMVAVMTMTPVYVQMHGEGLHVIGGIVSAHMLGMFALSPLTGRLADVRGGGTAIALGVGTLLASTLLAGLAPADDGVSLSLAMFLLGAGWNLCWIGGSTLLARGLPETERVQVQGDVDGIVWGSSAAASLISGGLLASGGFGLLVAVGGGAALLPLVPILRAREQRKVARGT